MNNGAISFGNYYQNYLKNGGGCFSDAHISEYIRIICNKRETPQVRLEVLSSFLSTPEFKTEQVIKLLQELKIDQDDPAFVALETELDGIISALKTRVH